MLAKTILVLYLLTGRSSVQIQYVVKFPTEAACQVEAKKYEPKGAWQAYPVQYATCVFDATGK